LFVIVFFLCVIPSTVFSGGKRDPILAKADSLINKKQYNEAIQILSEFIVSDNERFDSAQQRIRFILKNQGSYNTLVNQLLDVVEETPEDAEKIVALVEAIRQVDSSRSEEMRQFIERIQELPLFIVNRKRLERIMEEGKALLNAGQYVAALEKYQSGFVIYQDDLWKAGFGKDVEDAVRVNLNIANDAIKSIAQSLTPINNIKASLARAGGNASAAREAFTNALATLNPQLDKLIASKINFTGAGNFFSNESRNTNNSRQSGRYFFTMAAVFVRGRANQDTREGMLGVVDAIWKNIVFQLDDMYGDNSERLYTLALNSTEKGNYSEAEKNIAIAKNYIKVPVELAHKSKTFMDVDAKYDTSGIDNNNNVSLLIDNGILRFYSMDEALNYIDDARNIGVRYNTIQQRYANAKVVDAVVAKRITMEAAFTQIRDVRNTYQELSGLVENDILKIKKNTDALKAQKSSDVVSTATRYYADSKRVLESILKGITAGRMTSSKELYTIANASLEEKAAELEKNYAKSETLIAGIDIVTEQGQEVNAKYPREAIPVLSSMESDINESIQIGNTLIEEYKKEDQDESGEIRRLQETSIAVIEKIKVIEKNEERDKAIADERASRAEGLRKDGQRLLGEVRTAIKNSDFDLAREHLQGTVTRYSNSLELQEQPPLRREWVNQIQPLADEIARLEQEHVVKEVRVLINSSRDKYFNADFENAESNLMRAENMWARINPEPNDEVVYWLSLVRVSLSLRAGSTIQITAPLYPEVSQLLNDAQRNYNDGVSLIKFDSRDSGMQKFAIAREKTREVKLMFPVNQEAGMLELKINQVIDPDTFEETFRQRFTTAVAGTKRGSMESYIDLENLSNINPKYSGIKAAIT
jgi:tetratricopeptide (TPR) repeat protein